MTIQLVNLTVPGGDTPRSANTKINANFSDQTNAASRLVGTATGQIPLAEQTLNSFFATTKLGDQVPVTAFNESGELDLSKVLRGAYYFGTGSGVDKVSTPDSVGTRGLMTLFAFPSATPTSSFQMGYAFGSTRETELYIRAINSGIVRSWAKIYTNVNTTKEDGTGYLVASSPVLKAQHDSFEKVHEAEQLDIEVKNIETGVYEITGTTGLREGDGWNLKPPKDVNGNVLCICEATESNGVITLKTYKKRFDFETVSIVADYEQPTDIPEGATVMLRFNDLPLDDFQTNNP